MRVIGSSFRKKVVETIAICTLLFAGTAQPGCAVDKTKWMDLKREGQRLEMDRAYPSAERYYKLAMEAARFLSKELQRAHRDFVSHRKNLCHAGQILGSGGLLQTTRAVG